MPIDKGIVLYNIEKDGCLNGVYTNEATKGVIFNEIARKNALKSSLDIEGDYNCYYFEDNTPGTVATLKIKKTGSNMYEFSWQPQQGSSFKGIGYKMNEKQIAVRYEEV